MSEISTASALSPTAKTFVGDLIKGLDYIGLEVSDYAGWAQFAQDVLGLEVLTEASFRSLRLKMDDRPYRIILTRGPADDIVFAGWRVSDAAALDTYAQHLSDLGISYDWVPPEDLDLRGVDRMLRICDPTGVIHEVSTGLPADAPFVLKATKGRFVTGDGGLGHIVFGTDDYAGSAVFARDVLGAGTSDVVEQKITKTLTTHVTFLHVNERYHSVAFAARPRAKKLHHFMIEVECVDDVGGARDRHIETGLPILQDIGQHPGDNMISYYGATPSGFSVEIGWGHRPRG